MKRKELDDVKSKSKERKTKGKNEVSVSIKTSFYKCMSHEVVL